MATIEVQKMIVFLPAGSHCGSVFIEAPSALKPGPKPTYTILTGDTTAYNNTIRIRDVSEHPQIDAKDDKADRQREIHNGRSV